MDLKCTFSFGEICLSCAEDRGWKLSLTREEAPDGAEVAHLTFDSAEAQTPPLTLLHFAIPQKGLHYRWSVNVSDCGIPPNWSSTDKTDVAHGLPVRVYFDSTGTSRLAVAEEECVRQLELNDGIIEEGSRFQMKVTFFGAAEAPLSHYETRVRIDTRPKFFGDAVRESVSWLESACGFVPCVAPKQAFDPLYSSWYNFHQNVHAADIEAELAIAARLGMKTFIVDDGWQMDDTSRSYAFCGDWEVSKNCFPDMAAHVKRVQALGIKYMMWYSVPFIGFSSANFERFKGKFLGERTNLKTAILDPRFPEVREFLVGKYVKALKDWDIDGFKLDFIDSFAIWGDDPAAKENYAGRDIKSLPLAVDTLMTEIKKALEAIKPGILVEFRQSYIGSAIRKYGNMLRVADCPGNIAQNRVAIANLRLASGRTAVHSDMLEWNFSERPQDAALFIINSIFGVVQYSIMLREAPPEHLAMLEKWIRFSQEHRETLLHGDFRPLHPELKYPVIEAESKDELIIGLYDDGRILEVPEGKRTIVMNASGKDSFTIRRGGVAREIACPSGDWIEL